MSKKILYIEDDSINAFIMEKLLNNQYYFKHAEDGELGLLALESEPFDLVLMDINLGRGKIDGIETLKRLRKMPAYTTTPVMAVTSYALPEDEARFRAEGFDDYLSKPIDRIILLERIQLLLQ